VGDFTPNSDWLRELMDAGTRSINEERNKLQHPFPIRGSSALGCAREKGLRLRAGPDADKRLNSARSLRIFGLGDERGESNAQAFLAGLNARNMGAGVTFEREVWSPLNVDPVRAAQIAEACKSWAPHLEPPLRVDENGVLQLRSRLDVSAGLKRARTYNSYWELVVEMKTIAPYSYKVTKESGQPRDDHRAQCLFQLAGLHAELRPGTEAKCIIVYESKGDSEQWAVEVPWDPEEYDLLADRVSTLLVDWICGFPVEPSPFAPSEKTGKIPWQCDYCSIGPEKGECFPWLELKDKRRKGADIPKWHAYEAKEDTDAQDG
jgi:hypothetical protein